jgi:hypothetical protein
MWNCKFYVHGEMNSSDLFSGSEWNGVRLHLCGTANPNKPFVHLPDGKMIQYASVAE